MTREEAIDILNLIIEEGWLISDLDKCKAIDACDMAIKALEQEPCEDTDFLLWDDEDMKEMKKTKDFPPVNPPSKTGHWIVHEKPNGIRYLECSCCNIWYLNEHLLRNSYCSNCGATMTEILIGSESE